MGRPVVGVGADAAGHPDPWALRQAGYQVIAQYLGTPYQAYGVSRSYVDQCFEAGLGVILIMEEWSSQFLGGYPAAVDSCNRMMAAWDALGAPRDGSVIPHVVLVDPTPSAVYGAEGILQAYAKGWDDALPFPAWRGYGSKYGLDLAAQVTTKMILPWGVGTWGYGEQWNGALPDWTGDVADMIQHGNVAGWVGGIDHNSLYRLDLGAWGGQAPGPEEPPISSREDEMHLFHNTDDDSWVLVQGFEMEVAVDPARVWNLAVANVPHGDLSGGDIFALAISLSQMSDKQVAKVAAAVGGGGAPQDPADWSDADVVSEANKRVAAGQISVTGTQLVDS